MLHPRWTCRWSFRHLPAWRRWWPASSSCPPSQSGSKFENRLELKLLTTYTHILTHARTHANTQTHADTHANTQTHADTHRHTQTHIQIAHCFYLSLSLMNIHTLSYYLSIFQFYEWQNTLITYFNITYVNSTVSNGSPWKQLLFF